MKTKWPTRLILTLALMIMTLRSALADPIKMTISWDHPEPAPQLGLVGNGGQDAWVFELDLQGVEFVGKPTWIWLPKTGNNENWGDWNLSPAFNSLTWNAPLHFPQPTKNARLMVDVQGTIRKKHTPGTGPAGIDGVADNEEKAFHAKWNGDTKDQAGPYVYAPGVGMQTFGNPTTRGSSATPNKISPGGRISMGVSPSDYDLITAVNDQGSRNIYGKGPYDVSYTVVGADADIGPDHQATVTFKDFDSPDLMTPTVFINVHDDWLAKGGKTIKIVAMTVDRAPAVEPAPDSGTTVDPDDHSTWFYAPATGYTPKTEACVGNSDKLGQRVASPTTFTHEVRPNNPRDADDPPAGTQPPFYSLQTVDEVIGVKEAAFDLEDINPAWIAENPDFRSHLTPNQIALMNFNSTLRTTSFILTNNDQFDDTMDFGQFNEQQLGIFTDQSIANGTAGYKNRQDYKVGNRILGTYYNSFLAQGANRNNAVTACVRIRK